MSNEPRANSGNQDVLERNDQAVASEWRDEPGKTRGGQEDGMIRALDR
jgi:hypothetical protein